MEQLIELDDDVPELEEELYIPKSCLTAGQVVNLLRRMLHSVNPFYIDLAEHTAFCAIKIFELAKSKKNLNLGIDRDNLILLSLFFTIGAYKNDEIDLFDKDSKGNRQSNMFLYTFLFLKHLTPLDDVAEAVLFHGYSYSGAKELEFSYAEYSSLIFTCARFCVELQKNNYVFDESILSSEFIKECSSLYNPIYVDLFLEANKNGEITKEFQSGNYFSLLDEYCNSLKLNYDDTFSLLKMLIYTIDFISTSTVTHVISTAFHATEICKLENLSDSETDEVFTAAVIHDFGKLDVDVNILESSERLSESDMEKMRCHVKAGMKICDGIVSQKIADIAFRHHEALDGSGYPLGLTEKDLSVQQRILAVADIFSALTDARTYKPSFPKEKTIGILESMSNKNKIDSKIFADVKNNYDDIILQTQKRRPMLITNLGYVLVDYMQLKKYETIPDLITAIRQSSR